MASQEPPSKKRKLANGGNPQPNLIASLQREITPPLRSSTGTPADLASLDIPPINTNQPQDQDDGLTTDDGSTTEDGSEVEDEEPTTLPLKEIRILPSPVHLTRIRDLPASSNVDTVGLTDLLGDPLIKECWNFNFLFDLDFVM